tara:strand:+ start:592 stop:1275 length:684 start_codon:yes stop_codon:yes gene_type:complete
MSGWKAKNSFSKKLGAKYPPSYPNEMLVKICSSKKYSGLTKNLFSKKKIKVCEIGCLSGNNIRFFLDKKWATFGIEINKDLLKLAKKNLKRFKIKLNNLKIGNNENLPYNDDYFDLLVSINTIHYSSANKIDEAIKEYSRVLKKKGIAIIETPSPKHDAIKNSIKKKDNLWIWKWGGFRNNQKIGFFDKKEKFKKKLEKFFSKVEINERSEDYKNIKLYWYFAICKK